MPSRLVKMDEGVMMKLLQDLSWVYGYSICAHTIPYDTIRYDTIHYDLPRDPDEGLGGGNDGMIEDKKQNKTVPRAACRTRLSRISCIYL